MPACSVTGCDRPSRKRTWCSLHYGRWLRLGDVQANRPAQPRGVGETVRFWAMVDRTADGCWTWLGSLDQGYGRFVRDGGRQVYPHRFAYEQAHGPIADGLTLDHLCHTNETMCLGGPNCPHRRCVNPAHLEPVPAVVNTQRGRGGIVNHLNATARTTCPAGHQYGVESGGAKRCHDCRRERVREKASGRPTGRPPTVDADEVLRLASEGLTHTAIAAAVGCSPATVSRIKNGKQRTR